MPFNVTVYKMLNSEVINSSLNGVYHQASYTKHSTLVFLRTFKNCPLKGF